MGVCGRERICSAGERPFLGSPGGDACGAFHAEVRKTKGKGSPPRAALRDRRRVARARPRRLRPPPRPAPAPAPSCPSGSRAGRLGKGKAPAGFAPPPQRLPAPSCPSGSRAGCQAERAACGDKRALRQQQLNTRLSPEVRQCSGGTRASPLAKGGIEEVSRQNHGRIDHQCKR